MPTPPTQTPTPPRPVDPPAAVPPSPTREEDRGGSKATAPSPASPESSPAAPGRSSPSAESPGSSSKGATPSPSGPPASPGYFPGSGGDLVGRPSTPGAPTPADTPAFEAEGSTLAARVLGIVPDSRGGSGRPSVLSPLVARPPGRGDEPDPAGPPERVDIETADDRPEPRLAGMIDLEGFSLPAIDWPVVARFGSSIVNLFESENLATAEPTAGAFEPVADAGPASNHSTIAGRLWLITPACVGLGVALAARTRHQVGRWAGLAWSRGLSRFAGAPRIKARRKPRVA